MKGLLTHRQIECFQAVMRLRSMTKAAATLSVSQSAVSKITRELEATVGFKLFRRTKGGLEPSTEALALFAEVDRSFIGLERIAQAAERISVRREGVLRIAAIPALTSCFIQQVVKRFVEQARNVEISIDTFNSEEVSEVIAGGHADIGFAMTPSKSDRVRPGRVLEANCVCLLRAGHRLAGRKVVSLADLEGESFISLAQGTSTRMSIDAAFRTANISRQLLYTARWSVAVAAFVAAGLGTAISEPFSASLFALQGGIVRPMRERIPFSCVELFPKHAPTSPLILEFLDVLHAEFARVRAGDGARSG